MAKQTGRSQARGSAGRCRTNAGVNQVGEEFSTDGPGWSVPRLMRKQAERLDQKHIGEDRQDRAIRRERRLFARDRMPMADGQPRDFDGDQRDQHRDMQRPKPAEAADHKSLYFRTFRELFAIGMGDHEAAEHEEEIDEQPGVAHQRLPIEPAMHFEMMGRDQQCADAAPAVECPKSQWNRLLSRAETIPQSDAGKPSHRARSIAARGKEKAGRTLSHRPGLIFRSQSDG